MNCVRQDRPWRLTGSLRAGTWEPVVRQARVKRTRQHLLTERSEFPRVTRSAAPARQTTVIFLPDAARGREIVGRWAYIMKYLVVLVAARQLKANICELHLVKRGMVSAYRFQT